MRIKTASDVRKIQAIWKTDPEMTQLGRWLKCLPIGLFAGKDFEVSKESSHGSVYVRRVVQYPDGTQMIRTIAVFDAAGPVAIIQAPAMWYKSLLAAIPAIGEPRKKTYQELLDEQVLEDYYLLNS